MGKTKKDEEDTAFKGWYSKNKAELSERRKLKYRSDQAHRQAVIDRQRDYRAEHPTPSRAGQSDIREINGQMVKVVRIGEAGELIGRSDQTIRDWEARGLIPAPSVEASHRYYTPNQIIMMRELAEVISVMRSSDRKELSDVVEVKSAEIHNNWNN